MTPDKEIVWEFINPFYDNHERLGLTSFVSKAHRYGYEFDGFKGKDLEPDRFEWVLQEKGKPVAEDIAPDSKEEAVRSRLARLGY